MAKVRLKTHKDFYRSLYRIRRVEEEIANIYPSDKIKSPVHLSIGQEAISVGVCETLRRDDVVFGTYRGHALYLAKGGDLNKMIAELFGKATGSTKGKGGSMHLIDLNAGVMGQSAVVATTIPQAVGYAMAMKYLKSKRIVVSFFGDGAVEEGVFHESMNFAMLKKLPIIFICENNSLAIHSHQRVRQGFNSIHEFVRGYGMETHFLRNDDVVDVYKNVGKAVSDVRKGAGPVFFEIMTYRHREHVGPGEDFEVGYRKRDEKWFRSDQVKKAGNALPKIARGKIESEVEGEIRKAFEFAENSPFPDASELNKDLFKEVTE